MLRSSWEEPRMRRVAGSHRQNHCHNIAMALPMQFSSLGATGTQWQRPLAAGPRIGFCGAAGPACSTGLSSVARSDRCRDRRHEMDIVAAAAGQQAEAPAVETGWSQKTITLPAKARGCHVMTREITNQMPELRTFEVGLANFFLLHTSASLTINENASPDVPKDLNDWLDEVAPESNKYRHLDEGADDLPAHLKSSMMGASLDIPVRRGQLALGTWQGLYLNEHRNYGGPRQLVVTIHGQRSNKTYSQWS